LGVVCPSPPSLPPLLLLLLLPSSFLSLQPSSSLSLLLPRGWTTVLSNPSTRKFCPTL
jgi:hypothetical protein